MGSRAESTLRVGILGSLSIHAAGREVVLRSPQQRKVLAALLIADRRVSADELVDALWGEAPPATALGTLHTHVSRLRTTLGGGRRLISSDVTGYWLDRGVVETDAWRFEQLVAEAADALDGERRRPLLGDALGLWRGPALLDFRYEPFAQAEIARLEGLRLSALEQRIALDLDAGRAAALCGELESLVQDHPLHEGLHELLMLALYRCGRQTDALAAYQRVRRALRDELGLEPTPRLQALEHDILEHAPSLSNPSEQLVAGTQDVVTPPVNAADWLEGIDVPALDPKMTCELLLARGEGQRRGGREHEARSTYAAAVRLASVTGSNTQLAAAALGLAGPPEDAITGEALDEALMERAIRALPEDAPTVAMLRARLAVSLIDRGEVARGNEIADAAIAFARRVDDPAALAYTLRARRRTWFDPAALPERLAVSDELVDLGHSTGDPEVLAWGHRWRSGDLLEQGDLDGVSRDIDALEALTANLHDAFHWWAVVVRRAGLELLTGPPDKAEPGVMEALSLADQIRSPYTMAMSMSALWALRWQQGRLEELRDAILGIEVLSPTHVFLLPSLYRELDEPEKAADAYAALADDGFAELLDRDMSRVTRLFCLAVLADAASYVGDEERAPWLYAALAPLAGRLAAIQPGLTAIAPVDQALGQLAATMGDPHRSGQHFRAALARCREIGARTLEVRAHVAFAEALLGARDSNAHSSAGDLLATAAEAADELGMLGTIRRVDALSAHLPQLSRAWPSVT